MDDRQLLSQYISDASAEAFAEIVRRNVDMVYSSARRQLRDSHLAEDVTQAVFMLLARKARSVRGPVAGWLIAAACFACRDARKLAARREYHERQAGVMKLRQTGASVEMSWESYAPAVDAAMARLKRKDRDTIILRYLRGLSLKDVGDSLGVTEEAARKRVQRSVDRLRELIAANGTAVMLAEQLASRATETAPAKLVESIISASEAKGTLAALIAKKAAESMLAAKMKIAAIVLLALGIAGGATVSLLIVLDGNSAAGSVGQSDLPASAVPPKAAAVVAEVDVPGTIQLAQWDAVLDDRGAKGLTDAFSPVKTDSKFFHALRGSGRDFRAYIGSIQSKAGSLNLGYSLSFANDLPDGGRSLQLYLLYSLDRFSGMTSYGRPGSASFHAVGNNQLHVKLNYRDIELLFTARNWSWANPSQASIVFDGDLNAGEAVAFLADFVGTDGRTFHELNVWETFKARSDQMRYFNQIDCGWWCAHGPGQLRTWADLAMAWKAKAVHPLWQVLPAYEKKLEDGKVVRLVGLVQNLRAPFCWWDAQGNTVDGPNQTFSMTGDPSKSILAAVEIVGRRAEPLPGHSLNHDQPVEEMCGLPLQRRDGKLDFGVLVGPWTEAGRLQPGKSLILRGVSYRMQQPEKRSDGGFAVEIMLGSGNEQADYITAIGQDGAEHPPESGLYPELGIWKNSAGRGKYNVQFRDLALEDVKYFRLLQRKRQWVTFTNIALEPKDAPPVIGNAGN